MPDDLINQVPYGLAVLLFTNISKDLLRWHGSAAILLAIIWAMIFAFCDMLLPAAVMKTVYQGITIGLMAAGGYSAISQGSKHVKTARVEADTVTVNDRDGEDDEEEPPAPARKPRRPRKTTPPPT